MDMRFVRKLQKRPSRESGNPDGRRCVLDSCLRRNDDKDAGMNGFRTSLLLLPHPQEQFLFESIFFVPFGGVNQKRRVGIGSRFIDK